MKFIALYCMPAAGLEAWMAKDPAERKEAEEKMQREWNEWAAAHAAAIIESAGAGKTRRATASGITDVKNDVMLYSMIEADSPEAADALFANHPHLQIPGAWIDIMPANVVPSAR